MSDSSPAPCDNKKHPLIIGLILTRFVSRCRRSKKRSTEESPPAPAMAVGAKDGAEDGAAMRKSVKRLHFGGWEEKAEAASEIEIMARAGGRAKRLLAELGVIPSLVAMVVESPDRCQTAVAALIELADGIFINKVLMVEAGLLSKLPLLMACQHLSRKSNLAALLRSLSSLAKTQFPVAADGLLPFLAETLVANETVDGLKMAALASLHNLSTKLEHTKSIISSGAVPALLSLACDDRASESALSILGNLASTPSGANAIESYESVPKLFIDVMKDGDKPRCQELAGYVVMVLAYRSSSQRQKMVELGVIPVLLEVALLGTSLARRRAMKMLHWFKGEGRAKTGARSGPQAFLGGAKDCRREIKRMVRQSLDKNMESIMSRANFLSKDLSGIKALVVSSSSKSLPY